MAANTSELRKLVEHLQVSTGGGRGRRSQLYCWLWVRADAFEKLIAEVQPTWHTIAAALCRLNIKDGSGKPPNAERCRKAWFAVRQAKGWTAGARNIPTSRLVSNQSQHPPISAQPKDDEDEVLLRAGDGTVLTPKQPT